MAKLNILFSFVAILLISSAIPAFCKSNHHEKHPSPPQEEDEHDKYINSLPKDLLNFVENCTKKFPLKCGDKVINAINEKGNVDKKCCHDLVKMGLKCHKALIKVYIGLPEVKDKIDPKVVKHNANKVFKKCVALDKKKHHHSSLSPPILP
ncbi:PREDICTED: uncharacterized protein LOC109220176 [Nicotiana attenuata]|uniref:Prolamin-like domain-containing protein n=1 Tax=Nicotiana attenuata TaxID=49451 RepID=A0A1J6K5V8_NICAT|nr:PREDICTED: uncharacterized protein LOC109220176 [Nicotiana attenuata]OIT20432.1 hypothetical protein A4A49_37955 [Nicotiana attenuata]